MAKNEPQSYGSQSEWVTGKTGETVNRTSGHPTTQHGDFYESRNDSERSQGSQGGEVSPQQLAEDAQPLDACEVSSDDEQPVSKVTTARGGAKRDSAFKRRDYK
jgi:hypothetical protein